MSRLRSSFVPLAVFALALVARCIGFAWGLPNATRWGSYHPDESPHQIVGAVNQILQGGLNPHFFNYPSLCVYATTAIYYVLQIAGLTTQPPLTGYNWPLVHDIIVAGRLFSIFCGALTAVCVWGTAREVGLRRGAILSGILVALCPGLVQHSHFATVDVPATFFVAACLWATLRAMNFPAQTKWWIWSAVLAGLAAGTKYNAGLVIIAPLVALAVAQKGEVKPPKWLFAATIGLAALAFFVSTPYALLSPGEFWGDPNSPAQAGFAYELLVHPRQGSGDIFEGTGLGWIYHLTSNLPFVLTWPLLLAGLGGAFLAVKDRRHWPLLAFALVYFLIIGLSNVRFMRYTFLLVPPLLLWASIAVSRLPKPRIWGSLLIIFAFIGTENVLYPLSTTDPRDQAIAYLRQVGGNPTLIGKPWFYTPPFQPNNNNVPVAGVKSVGLDASQISQQSDTLIVSDYEVREAIRLHPDGAEAKFLAEAQKRSTTGKRGEFENTNPLALPGREFEPHDYLYTHPHVWVYR